MVAGLAAGQGAAATGAWLGGARMDTLDSMVLQSPRYDRPREQTLGRGHT